MGRGLLLSIACALYTCLSEDDAKCKHIPVLALLLAHFYQWTGLTVPLFRHMCSLPLQQTFGLALSACLDGMLGTLSTIGQHSFSVQPRACSLPRHSCFTHFV